MRYLLSQRRHQLRDLVAHRGFRELEDLLRRRRQRTDELAAHLADGLRARLDRLRRRFTLAGTRLVSVDLRARLRAFALRLEQRSAGLGTRVERLLVAKRQRLDRLRLQLEERNPLRVLERGYAVCYDAAGNVVHSADAVALGDRIRVQLSRGRLSADAQGKE